MQEIIIIGSSHIAKQSLIEVENTILKEKPDFVAIELDKKRFASLLSGAKGSLRVTDIRRFGIGGFLFNLVGGWIQKKLGKAVGVKPGSEMLMAVKSAKKIGAKVALIDMDVEIIMKKFSKYFRWKDKWHLIRDIFLSLIFRKREMKKLGLENTDLTKVPPKEIIKKLMERVKNDYPGIYKVLIHDRNIYMANQLMQMQFKYPDKKIVAVMGAGHEEGIRELLKNKNKISFTYSVG